MEKEILKVYGRINCSLCDTTKQKLEMMSVEYEYYDIDNLSKDDKKNIMMKAKLTGQQSLPILIFKDEITTIENIIKELI